MRAPSRAIHDLVDPEVACQIDDIGRPFCFGQSGVTGMDHIVGSPPAASFRSLLRSLADTNSSLKSPGVV
jgi:hypothetical protein